MKYLKQLLFTTLYLSFFLNYSTAQTVINLASQCNCEVLSGPIVPTPGAPSANAGNLYVNTATGDIYTYDGTAWNIVSEDQPDHDWYVAGGTTPPTSINDNVTTMGRVGIGVASPLQDLHVAGNIRTDTRSIFFGGAQRLFGNNGSILYFNSNSATVSKFLLRDSDNVLYGGIVGTSDGLNFGMNDKDDHWTFRSVHDQYLTMSVDNSEKVRIMDSGNVGIGTNAPTALLDVNGTARLRNIGAGTATEMELVVDANGMIKKRTSGDNSSTNELPAAGNDTDVSGNTVNIEPKLDFVHSVYSPNQNLTLAAGGNIFMRAWFDGHVGVGNLPNSLTPAAGLHVSHDDGMIADGTFGTGLYNAAGSGTRLVWSSKNASFRAGQVSGTQWDEANIGNYSTAFGFSTTASGGFSFAGGDDATASGNYSFAYGSSPTASGNNSLAIGTNATASNTNTIALGNGTMATGNASIAIGFNAQATGTGSKAFGGETVSSGFNAVAIGEGTTAVSRGEVTVGMFQTTYAPANANGWNAADRIFSVGVGQNATNRADALRMYKDGRSRFHGYMEVIADNSVSDEGLNVNYEGSGTAQVLNVANTTNTNDAFYVQLTHLGKGVHVSTLNSNNDEPSVSGFHRGTGEGVFGAGSLQQGGLKGTNKKTAANQWYSIQFANLAPGTAGTTDDGVAGVSGHVWKPAAADIRDVQGGYFSTHHGPAGGAVTNYSSARVAYVDAGGTPRKIDGTGAAGTIVTNTANQPVLMTAVESPEILFTDYGIGKLVNGKAVIKLDPNYTKNIVVDGKNKMKVFVQLEGDCNGVYVTNKTATGFEVIELQGGTSNVEFSYEVVANRANVVENGNHFIYDSSKRFAPGPKEYEVRGVEATAPGEQ